MDQKKTILIAGATGFVGKELVEHLLAFDYDVKIITRDVNKAKDIFPKRISVLPWPNKTDTRVLPSIYSCHALINLAGGNIGNLRWTKRNKQEILNSRIKSVDSLVSMVAQMQESPKVWIQASAIGFYGANTLEPINESGIQGTGFLANVVSRWESALESKPLEGVRKVYLRLGIVISPKGGFLKKMSTLFNLGIAICPGKGNQKISWIHLSDLVEIVRISIENQNYSGKINVISPKPITFFDFSKILKKHTMAILAVKIPAFVFRIFLGKDKTNEMLLANQDIIPVKLLDQNFQFNYVSFQEIFKK